jgi:hypothetical protein
LLLLLLLLGALLQVALAQLLHPGIALCSLHRFMLPNDCLQPPIIGQAFSDCIIEMVAEVLRPLGAL